MIINYNNFCWFITLGCYILSDGTLWFNTYLSSKTPCNEIQKCICIETHLRPVFSGKFFRMFKCDKMNRRNFCK